MLYYNAGNAEKIYLTEEKRNRLRIMRRKAADNERTCYPFTVEKKDMKKHDMI